MILNWKVSDRDSKLIEGIADRALAIAAGKRKKSDFLMDITACHANGCPLDLHALMMAEPFDFSHDVFGIERHLDRSSGHLMNCFTPRFSVSIPATEVK